MALKAYNSDDTPQQDSAGQQVYIDMRHTIFPLRLRGILLLNFISH